jgi:hypothetical protein
LATAAERKPGPFASTGSNAGRPTSQGPVESGERDAFHDNQPPLGERIIMDFAEDLEKPGELGALSVKARVAELLASAGRAPETCDNERAAGAMGDLCKQARQVAARLEEIREKHNRPLIEAKTALKAQADGLIQPLLDAVADIRGRVDKWLAAEEARRREEERRAQEEERRLREEQQRIAAEREAATGQPAEPRVEISAPAPPPRPMARGDYGARVGTRQAFPHKIISVRQLPDRILNNIRVKEAIDKVIAAEIRNGAREIKGVEITPVVTSTIR